MKPFLLFLTLGLISNPAFSAEQCQFAFLPKPTVSHVVATSSNFVIGNEHNQMPWGHALKQDLKRFRDLTSNHIVIMGRKTYQTMYESLGGKPLPNRLSLVITRDPGQIQPHENVIAVESVEEALRVSRDHFDKYPSEVFVVGGGEIFTKTYDRVDNLYLTLIQKDIDGVVHYPQVDFSKYEILSKEEREEAGYSYQFLNLKIKK